MGQITICDICKQVISEGDKKYIMGINPVNESGRIKKKVTDFHETAEILISNTYRYGKCQLFEICTECKKVLEYLFRLRKKELKKLKREVEKMYKIKKEGEETGRQ